QRMQVFALGQTFDGADRLAVGLHGEHQATANRSTVDQNRAGAAHAMLASDVSAGEAAILPDCVGKRPPRLHAQAIGPPVDHEHDRMAGAHCAACMAARNAARIRCGVAGNSLMVAPNGAIASLIALMTAAGAPIVPPSPTPFACVTVASLSVSI